MTTDHNSIEIPIGTTFEEMEKALLIATLKKNNGSKVLTAKDLGVAEKTVYNLMEKHGLRRPVLIRQMRDV